MPLRSNAHAASKKPVRPVTVRTWPTGVLMSRPSSSMRRFEKLPHQTKTRASSPSPSTRTVGSMLWIVFGVGTRWEMIGAPTWSVQGPVGDSETATPMPNASLAGLSASCTGTYQ
ncbi:Uncharacterised protein [Mycobacteroides abscessus]|nr:Uncharacterised protein [Mycobacteroides abscessus]